MKHNIFSVLPLLLIMIVTILFGGTLSVKACAMDRDVSVKSGVMAGSRSTTGNMYRRQTRELRATISRTKISVTADDDHIDITSTTKDDVDTLVSTSANKGSIASRTSSVVDTKESSSSVQESMGIHVVKPKTASPSVAPPITTKTSTTKSSHLITSNITSLSSSTSAKSKSATSHASSPTAAGALAPIRTSYPTTVNLGSIASRTSNIDSQTRAPKSLSMDFTMAKTASPSALKSTSNSSNSGRTKSFAINTKASSMESYTRGELRDRKSVV